MKQKILAVLFFLITSVYSFATGQHQETFFEEDERNLVVENPQEIREKRKRCLGVIKQLFRRQVVEVCCSVATSSSTTYIPPIFWKTLYGLWLV